MTKPDPKCILDNPETDCIKNPTQMLEGKLVGSDKFSSENSGKAFNTGLSYITSLVDMCSNLIKAKCGDVLGNKFLYEYGKCEDQNGNIQTRYKYIDATCEAGGMFGREGAGLIPCTINSALGVGESAVGIPMAIFEDAVPPCKLENVSCKVSNKGKGNFTEDTQAYIAKDDYGSTDNPAPVGFENLYESVNEYMKENDLNFSNIKDEKASNSNKLKNDSTINEMYYIMLMLFFLFIIYKLIHKK